MRWEVWRDGVHSARERGPQLYEQEAEAQGKPKNPT